jgi:hypothetical protein
MLPENILEKIKNESEYEYPQSYTNEVLFGTNIKHIRSSYSRGAKTWANRAEELRYVLEKVLRECELGIVHSTGNYIKSIVAEAINNYNKTINNKP